MRKPEGQKPKPLGLQHRIIMRRLREEIAQSKQEKEKQKK